MTENIFFESVLLTPEELKIAIDEGDRRQTYNQSHNVKGRGGAPERGDHSRRLNIEGAIGEYAVARYLNMTADVFKEYKPIPGSFDLPPNIDVKTPASHNRRLVIWLNDNPKKIFVLATYEGKEVRLHGWTYGDRVMKDCFIEDPIGRGPRYYVPKSVLKPMALLKSFLVDLGYSK